MVDRSWLRAGRTIWTRIRVRAFQFDTMWTYSQAVGEVRRGADEKWKHVAGAAFVESDSYAIALLHLRMLRVTRWGLFSRRGVQIFESVAYGKRNDNDATRQTQTLGLPLSSGYLVPRLRLSRASCRLRSSVEGARFVTTYTHLYDDHHNRVKH